jgi:hypothetical protein
MLAMLNVLSATGIYVILPLLALLPLDEPPLLQAVKLRATAPASMIPTIKGNPKSLFVFIKNPFN